MPPTVLLLHSVPLLRISRLSNVPGLTVEALLHICRLSNDNLSQRMKASRVSHPCLQGQLGIAHMWTHAGRRFTCSEGTADRIFMYLRPLWHGRATFYTEIGRRKRMPVSAVAAVTRSIPLLLLRVKGLIVSRLGLSVAWPWLTWRLLHRSRRSATHRPSAGRYGAPNLSKTLATPVLALPPRREKAFKCLPYVQASKGSLVPLFCLSVQASKGSQVPLFCLSLTIEPCSRWPYLPT